MDNKQKRQKPWSACLRRAIWKETKRQQIPDFQRFKMNQQYSDYCLHHHSYQKLPANQAHLTKQTEKANE